MNECIELMCDDIKFYVTYNIFAGNFNIRDISLRKHNDYTSNVPAIYTVYFDILFIDCIEKYIIDTYGCNRVTIRLLYEPMPDISFSSKKMSFLYNNVRILNTFVKAGYTFDEHVFDGGDYYDVDFQMFLLKIF